MVLYCASGQRSALAAQTLQDLLGYENVESMRGGITLWKDRGYDVEVPRSLTAEQRERYSRHLLVPEIGLEGQLKLLDAKVLLLGAGGLGSPAALYLAAAGVGTLGIVDNDVVDLSNLQRQVAHSNERVGMPKVDSAEISIHEINPEVKVEKYPVRIDASNIMEIIEGYDVIVDGLDNFPTRYLLNDASVRLQIPVVSASILGFEGQLSVFHPYEGPCYRCLYPTPPPAELAPSCGAAGVLGVLPGVMGLLQSVEVIKLVTGAGESLAGRLLLYDALGTTFTELKVRRDPDCPICSREPGEISDEEMGVFPDYELFCSRRRLARTGAASGSVARLRAGSLPASLASGLASLGARGEAAQRTDRPAPRTSRRQAAVVQSPAPAKRTLIVQRPCRGSSWRRGAGARRG